MNHTDVQTESPPALAGPYSGLPAGEQRRLNSTVSATDRDLIHNVSPLHGTFNIIIGTFIRHIANELRRQNIHTYNPNAVLAIVSKCTHSCPDGPSSAPDDAGPASRVPTTGPGDAVQPAHPGSPVARGKRRAGGK